MNRKIKFKAISPTVELHLFYFSYNYHIIYHALKIENKVILSIIVTKLLNP